MRRHVVLFASALLLAVVLDPAPSAWAAGQRPSADRGLAALAADGPRCHQTGWRKIDLPGARRAIGMDLATSGGRVRWVVGMSAGAAIPRQPWVVRRTRSGWEQVPVPRLGADAGLVAVAADGSRRAWAVGFRVRSRDLQPVAVRWNGRSWRAASPPGSGRTTTLTDVSTGAHTWAVGYRTTGSGPRPYAVHREGGRWVRHHVPLPRGRFGALTAVGGDTRTRTWAAGWQSDGRGVWALLAEWRGGRWKAVELPGSDQADTVLTGLTAEAGRLWAVGYRDDGHQQVPVIYLRRSDAWSAVPVAATSASIQADDLVVSDGSLLVSGGARPAGRSGMGHAVATVTDARVTLTPRPAGIGKASYLRAIASDGPAGLVAVGWTDGRAIAVRSCRTTAPGGSMPLSAHPVPSDPVFRGGDRQGSGHPVRDGYRDGRAVGSGQPPTAPDGALVTPGGVDVRFRDVAVAAGIDMTTVTYGATALDLDGNGWQDLLISRHTGPARVLMNRKGRFVRAAADPLPGKDRHGCAAADVDADGRDEAFCAVGAARGVKFKSNELVLDLQAEAGRNDAGRWGLVEPLGRGRRAAFVGLDGDDHPDLIVTADPIRVDGLPARNRAYRNDDARGYLPAAEAGLDLPLGGDCAFSAQLDGRGAHEIVLCTDEPWAGRPRGLHVFRRAGARYVDATAALGVRPDGAIDAVAADFDGDGRTDLAQLSTSSLTVSLQRGGRLRRVVTLAVRSGQAIAAGDVNRDGRADIYLVGGSPGNAPDRLLVNAGAGRRFRDAAIPQARGGSGEDVVALDHDRNGLVDFLVLNGLDRAGPVQLIASYRR